MRYLELLKRKGMNAISVRKATLDDLETLLEYEQGLISAERPFDATLAENPVTYYDLPKLISSETAEVVVAEIQNKIVSCGYAMVKEARHYLDHQEYAYLGFMFTHPDFRGMGVNAKILDVLKTWSTQMGLTELRLTVYDGNLSAIKAYEKYGFKKHIIEMRLPRGAADLP